MSDSQRKKKEQKDGKMSADECIVCDDQFVDADEVLSPDGVSYHDTCLKCSQCDEKLSDNNYSSFDGALYCKPHFEQTSKKNTRSRLPRGLSLPKPSELRKTSSSISSIFFKTQAKQVASKLPPSGKKEVPRTILEAKGDNEYTSYPLTTTNQTLHLPLRPAGDQLDQDTIMNLFMQNPALNGLLEGVSNRTEFESHEFLTNMLEQLTQNPEMMNAMNQLGQQMDRNQNLGSMFASMDDDLDMSFMAQHMMTLFSQASHQPSSSSMLLEHNPPTKHGLHRRSYSDSASLNVLSTDCQMNLKEAAQKIEDEYPSIEIFSSVVESAALLHDHVYDIYGLADLCSEEELAEEFMEMLKSDVCRRLGKRYNRCSSIC